MGEQTHQETNEQKTTKSAVRKHKKYGEYKKVIVTPKEANKLNTEIYVGLNDFSAQFKPDIEVELPADIIKFLKGATYEQHIYDEKNKKHTTISKAKYLVELVETKAE